MHKKQQQHNKKKKKHIQEQVEKLTEKEIARKQRKNEIKKIWEEVINEIQKSI